MARNGSGTYTVPNTFSAGATISSSDHNENFDDLGDEITNSVAVDGQSSMTGPLKASNGSVSAPSLAFASDPDTGIYRSSANSIGIALAGSQVAEFSPTGVQVSLTANFTAPVLFTGAITASATANFVAGFVASGTATFSTGILVSGTATFADPILVSGTATFTKGFIASATSSFSDVILVSGTATFTKGFIASATSTFTVGPIASNIPKVWGIVTYSGGTPTLQASGGVASITDAGTGALTVTFTTAFGSTNYSALATAGSTGALVANTETHTTGAVTIVTRVLSGGTFITADPDRISFAIFGT